MLWSGKFCHIEPRNKGQLVDWTCNELTIIQDIALLQSELTIFNLRKHFHNKSMHAVQCTIFLKCLSITSSPSEHMRSEIERTTPRNEAPLLKWLVQNVRGQHFNKGHI